MAHMIDTMAYANETPWHGLGVPVWNALTPEQMREAAGLTWNLIKQPVFATLPNGKTFPIPNRYALMRDSDGQSYDIVSDLYKPVQPGQALDFFKRFVEAGDMQEAKASPNRLRNPQRSTRMTSTAPAA